jgi:hypothetical protein
MFRDWALSVNAAFWRIIGVDSVISITMYLRKLIVDLLTLISGSMISRGVSGELLILLTKDICSVYNENLLSSKF